MQTDDFLQMKAGEDGWCEWVHPLPGYLMACCDCGLVHEMEFAIVAAQPDNLTFNDGEDTGHIVIFRARRTDQLG